MRQGASSSGNEGNNNPQPTLRSSKAKMTRNHPSGNQYELHPNYLGNMKKKKLPWIGKEIIVSPDLAAWIGPTTVSLVLAIGGLLLAGDLMAWYEHLAFYVDVLCAFTLSLLCGTTDPGIYPRLARGEPDPLEYESYKRCDACGLKRPPRTAHCYLCGVCVLEHDHHCGIVGGCIGQRTLRFFVGYLCTISSSATMMFLFLLRSIFRFSAGMFSTPAGRRGARHAAKLLTVAPGTSAVTEAAQSVMKKDASLQFALHIMVMMMIVNIALITGCMAIFYVGLMATDTTRRESQGKGTKKGGDVVGSGGAWWNLYNCAWITNCKRAWKPPPSGIEYEELQTNSVYV